jgi:tetratricopeptide (TPR) repeat protein
VKRLGDPPDLELKLARGLGLLAQRKGRFQEAEDHYRRSVALAEQIQGLDSLAVSYSLEFLNDLLVELGRYDEVKPLLERALLIREQALGPDHPGLGPSLQNLGTVLGRTGRWEEALKVFDRDLTIDVASVGPDDVLLVTDLTFIANALRRLGRLHEARASADRALAIIGKHEGSDQLDRAELLQVVGQIELDEHRPADARSVLVDASKIWAGWIDQRFNLAETRFALAQALWELGDDKKEARNLADLARKGYAEAPGDHIEQVAVETWLQTHVDR